MLWCRTFIKLMNASEAQFVGAEVLALLLGIDDASFPTFKDDFFDVFAFGILCPGGAHECLQQYLVQNEGYTVVKASYEDLGGDCSMCPEEAQSFGIGQSILKRPDGTEVQFRSIHEGSTPSSNDTNYRFRAHVCILADLLLGLADYSCICRARRVCCHGLVRR